MIGAKKLGLLLKMPERLLVPSIIPCSPMRILKKVPAYVHLKFKLKEGNMIDANVGAPIDNLLMRVEEMYFIEAEAIAASQGGKRWNFCFGEFYENLSLQFLPMYGICYGRFS